MNKDFFAKPGFFRAKNGSSLLPEGSVIIYFFSPGYHQDRTSIRGIYASSVGVVYVFGEENEGWRYSSKILSVAEDCFTIGFVDSWGQDAKGFLAFSLLESFVPPDEIINKLPSHCLHEYLTSK
jgi:hypothetical protein